MPREAAHVATEIYGAIRENVATKTDVAAVRNELKTDIASAQRFTRTGAAV
jgi:hypothetical protein